MRTTFLVSAIALFINGVALFFLLPPYTAMSAEYLAHAVIMATDIASAVGLFFLWCINNIGKKAAA